MVKKNSQYQCQSCQAVSSKWQGRCFSCGSWDSLLEVRHSVVKNTHKNSGFTGLEQAKAVNLESLQATPIDRIITSWQELDRVLGGGLVPGSVSLLGGDPGVGKSTLLLQLLCLLGKQGHKVLYVTGEESSDQVALRATRLNLPKDECWILAATDIDIVLQQVKDTKSKIVVIDSIQTMCQSDLSAASGSVSQVRECALELTHLAKQTKTSIFLIGHMTKEGHVAGPRVLEHMVDTVLYLEGEQSGRYRMLRASKNRFGPVHELGVFAMQEIGLKEVRHPSLLFLSKDSSSSSGSVITSSWEGSRALLVELQTLVDSTNSQNPRRVVMGLDSQRVNMLLAILHKHAGVACHSKDIFINVVGGLKITQTSADLALCMAIFSSLCNIVLPRGLFVMGELGLNGEVRPVQQGQSRIAAACKHGITHIMAPSSNRLQKMPKGVRLLQVSHIMQAKQVLLEITKDSSLVDN